jgi:uncharacterized membrane protein YkoI
MNNTLSLIKGSTMHSYRLFIFVLFSFLSQPLFSAQLAEDIEPGDGVNEIQLPLTKQSASELIRVESQGKVLSVDQANHDGKIIFKIKVLHDNGKIKIYRLDPNTGYAVK